MIVGCCARRVAAVPVRRDGRLHDRAPAGVPRRRARARARDAGGRGAPAGARLPRSARTASSTWRRTSCAARTACASSRTRAGTAASRWTRSGRSARTARPRCPGYARRPAGGAVARRRARSSSGATASLETPPYPLTNPRRTEHPMDRTLILVKPDAFARGLTGEIIARFERKGLTIVALKHMQVTEDLAKQHYAEHEASRSSASSSSSSPPRRSSPWSSRATRRSPPRARSSARRTRWRPPRARSAATSPWRSARTWSTARTRPSRPRARPASSSRAPAT